MVNKYNLYKEYTYEGQSYYESDSFDSPIRDYLMDKCKYIVRDYENNLIFNFIIYRDSDVVDIDSKSLDTAIIKSDISEGVFVLTFYNFRHEKIFNVSFEVYDIENTPEIEFYIDQDTAKEIFNIGTYYMTLNVLDFEGQIKETVFSDRLLYIK